jgi:hypothetical protein
VSAALPNKRLATWAVVLALVLFSPVGADILFSASRKSVPIYAALIAVFFVATITPVVLLYRRSGLAGFLAAPIRIAITLLILALFLLVHISSLVHLAQ